MPWKVEATSTPLWADSKRTLKKGLIAKDEEFIVAHVEYVKDQVGVPLDKPIPVGKPMPETELKKRTSEFHVLYDPFRKDEELIGWVQRIHMLRTMAGNDPESIKGI